MVGATGNRVTGLHREAIGQFALPDSLVAGAWCWLETDELKQLEQPWPSAMS